MNIIQRFALHCGHGSSSRVNALASDLPQKGRSGLSTIFIISLCGFLGHANRTLSLSFILSLSRTIFVQLHGSCHALYHITNLYHSITSSNSFKWCQSVTLSNEYINSFFLLLQQTARPRRPYHGEEGKNTLALFGRAAASPRDFRSDSIDLPVDTCIWREPANVVKF